MRGAMVCGRARPGPGVPWRAQKRLRATGWALAIPMYSREAWLGTRYSTLPVPPSITPPRVPPLPRAGAAVHTTTSTPAPARTALLRSTKEILGVNNAHVDLRCSAGGLTHEAAVPPGPPYASCCRYSLRCSPYLPILHILSISQYFSVFLRYLSVYSVFLSIPQYFSVIRPLGAQGGPAARSSCRKMRSSGDNVDAAGVSDVRQLVTVNPRPWDGAHLVTLCRFDE